MNKILASVMLLWSCLLLPSCSDDNSYFNEPAPIRSYETDANVLIQFVDVDNSTGKFIINPNKKINASDYIVNRSLDELMAVSPLNRERFIDEMEEVNAILHSVKQSGLSTAIIYSTATSNSIISGDNTAFIALESQAFATKSESTLANLTVTADKCSPKTFCPQKEMTMNIAAGSRSLFYCYQLSFGDVSNPDRGIVVFSGVRNPRENSPYRLISRSSNDLMTVTGQNIVGDGTLSVSISK